MTDETVGQAGPRGSLVELANALFHRLVACCCIMFGLYYWVRLVGYYSGDLWRFDLMPAHWQIASVGLAVLFPFAASGLWMVATWGPVIWFICAAAEAVMYLGLPEMYGARPGLIVVHAATLVVFAAFAVALQLEARRRRTEY